MPEITPEIPSDPVERASKILSSTLSSVQKRGPGQNLEKSRIQLRLAVIALLGSAEQMLAQSMKRRHILVQVAQGLNIPEPSQFSVSILKSKINYALAKYLTESEFVGRPKVLL